MKVSFWLPETLTGRRGIEERKIKYVRAGHDSGREM